jgi:hypothetical protein
MAGAATNHPRRVCTYHLGAEAGSAGAAGVIRGTPPPLPNPHKKIKSAGMVAAGGAANHPRRHRATHLGAEAGSAAVAGVIYDTPAATKPSRK